MSGRSLISWLGAVAVLTATAAATGGAASAQGAGFAGSSVQTVDFVNATLGYAVIQLATEHPVVELLRTVNGGRSWVTVSRHLPKSKNSGLGYTVVSGISFVNRSAGAILVPESPGACQLGFLVYTTANGGRSWHGDGQVVGSDGPTEIAHGKGGPWVLNGSCAGAWVSLYAKTGGHWAQARNFTLTKAEAKTYFSPAAVSLERAASGATMEAAAYSPLKGDHQALIDAYRRAAGSGSWRHVKVGAAGLTAMVRNLAMYSPTEGLAVTSGSSAHSISLEVTANGRTWGPAKGLRIPASSEITDLQFVSAVQAFITVNGVLWSSTNDGMRWQQVGRVA